MEMFEELRSLLLNNFFIAIPPADVFRQSMSVFGGSTVPFCLAVRTRGGTRLGALCSDFPMAL